MRHIYTSAFKKIYPIYNKIINRDTFGVARQRISSQYASADIIAAEQL